VPTASRIILFAVSCCLAEGRLQPFAGALALAEREDRSRATVSGWSLRQIATRLDRAALTVSREVTSHYREHDWE